MEGCLFCKIVSGELPSYMISEDGDFVAFLSIFPKYPGMTMVVTKKHFGSYLYESLSDEMLSGMHVFAKKVALVLDDAMGCERNLLVMEGFEVDHAHLKLYPFPKGENPESFLGVEVPKASDEELLKVAEKIRKVVK